MNLEALKLPELTDSKISITYNHDLISFINEDNPTEGNLLNQGFEIQSIRSVIELIYKIKNLKVSSLKDDYHPLVKKIIK